MVKNLIDGFLEHTLRQSQKFLRIATCIYGANLQVEAGGGGSFVASCLLAFHTERNN